jgi:hypothetical protein
MLRDATKSCPVILSSAKNTLQNLERLHRYWYMISPSKESYPLKHRLPENEILSPRRYFKSYITLGYCWRSPEWNPFEEACRGVNDSIQWPISTFMFCGLPEQCQSLDEGIWIDAICISQNDEIEKTDAVRPMDINFEVLAGKMVEIPHMLYPKSSPLVVFASSYYPISDLHRPLPQH